MASLSNDDLYYWPGDDEFVSVQKVDEDKAKETYIVSKIGSDENGATTVDNYIYSEKDPEWFAKVQAYNLDNLEDENQDTIIYVEDLDEDYVINNYYVDDEYSYADRIRYFHDPYYYGAYSYDPYPYYSYGAYPHYRYNSLVWGAYGWGGYYSRFYSGFYDPWLYDPWYYGGYSSAYAYYGYYDGFYLSHYGGYSHGYYDGFTVGTRHESKSRRRSRNPNLVSTSNGGGSDLYAMTDARVQGNHVSSGGSQRNSDRRRVVSAKDSERKTVVKVNDDLIAQKPVRSNNVLTEKRRSTTKLNERVVSNDARKNQVYRTVTSNPTRTVYNSSSVDRSSSARVSTPAYKKPRTVTNSSNPNYNTARSADRTRSAVNSASDKRAYTIPSSNRSNSKTSTRTTYSRSKQYNSRPAATNSSSRSTYRSTNSSRSTSTPSSSSRSYTPSSNSSSNRSYTPRSSSSGSSRSYNSSSRSSGSSRSTGSSRSGSSRR